MDDFTVLVHSLGEHAVDYIGRDALTQLRVAADALAGRAHIDICLADRSGDSELRAIDSMISLRQVFFDDISIDYAFQSPSACAGLDSQATRPAEFIYA